MKTLFLDSGQGVLPFIKEILRQEKKSDFLFYLDEIHFPYGNKNKDEVKKILDDLLNYFSLEFKIDKVFIACNTLSSLLDKNKKYPFLIDNILDFNLKNMDEDTYYLGTKITSEILKLKNIKSFAAPKLAFLIENIKINELIKYLKETHFPKKIVLGCTHYPLIKFLFTRYTNCQIFSYEDKYINQYINEEKLSLTMYTNKKEIYQKIINFQDINFIAPTYISCRREIR